jgi:hypothetical protein
MLAELALAAAKVPKDGEGVKSGPLGLAVILVLCVAVYFLMKSMSKHLKRVREDFPTDKPAPIRNAPVAPADASQPAVDTPAGEAAAKPDSA